MIVVGLWPEKILSIREWAPPIVVVLSTTVSDPLTAVVCPVSLVAETKDPSDSAVGHDSEDADAIEEEVPARLELLLLRLDWHGFGLGCCIVVSVEGRNAKNYARVLF